MRNVTEKKIQDELRANSDPKFHQLIYDAFGVRMSVSNVNADKLTVAANESECSKLGYVKEMVRLFNLNPSDTTLTLTVVTSRTEYYTGMENGVEAD